ncbi:zinc-binding dehydrogenase (plasmid) [Lacticaseibacillus paracasei]|uniref:zinc-binding dehydrogenase n=1 Tax=Lacticaseibacillus paracasei TaxID=1597 RepID=UPI00209DAEED|nr:zinc-binding dehydrogenase [Lacticaseibacillus paracasei]UVH25130.1 zinc-binding dehydrogenase [Lacticaseibacillus paracasei]
MDAVKTKTMKAVVKSEPGYDHMSLKNVPIPEVTGNHVLMKVAYTGICGTDVHTFKGEYANAVTPLTLGHEFSGKVVAVGDQVTKVRPGDRVTSETTFSTCGHCVYCKAGEYNLCEERVGIGTKANGSMANYVLTREESVHILPDNVSYKMAALSEPLACCVHAMYQKTPFTLHDKLLIMGPGPMGLLSLQIAKEIGAFTIVSGITKDTERLQIAKELGADIVVDTQKEDLAKVIMDATDGVGVTKVYDCSGAISAVNSALPLIRKGGTFQQVGLFAKPLNALDERTIIQHEINYIGSRSQNPYDWPIALHLESKGAIDQDKMITKVFDLDHWRDALEAMMAGQELKVMIASNPDDPDFQN